MKKILTYCSLILALNLSAGEGEEVPAEAPQNSGERKTEVKKSGYSAVSTRSTKAEPVSYTRATSRSTTISRTLNRVNLRRPTASVTSRNGSVGGATSASSSL